MLDPSSAADTKKRRSQRGFSLAEVLVAVALLAVIMLALFGLVSSGVKRAYSGKKMTQASILAQHVLERANIYAPQDLLPVTAPDTATKTWSKAGPADAQTTPAAEVGTTQAIRERNAWRALLAQADLPATAANPATLTVTATGVSKNTTEALTAAPMVRIVVDLQWTEWGTRTRRVRLQGLNLRTTP